MTFFLSEPQQIPEIKANNPGVDMPGFLGGVGAAFSKAQLDNNANFRFERERKNEHRELAISVIDVLGTDTVQSIVNDYNQSELPPGFTPSREQLETAVGAGGAALYERILERARVLSDADTEASNGMDLSLEGVEARVNARLGAEQEELRATLNLMNGGQGWASLIGGMAGVTLDVKNIPFLLFGGGGGSVLRAAGRGAMINVAAEAAFIPDQIEMAERLGNEAPDIPMQLAVAALGGAAFDGGLNALARGFRWMKMRGQAKQITEFLSELEEAQALDAVEEALATSGQPPATATAQTLDEYWGRAASRDDRPFAPILEDDVSPPVDEAARIAHEQRVDEIDEAILSSHPAMRFQYPLAETIAERGGIALRRQNGAGEWEATLVADELRSMGVDPKQHLRLFRKNGHADLDNLTAAEFDGLDQVIKVDPDTGYFDRDALVRALGEELTTGRKTPLNGEVAALMAERDAPLTRTNDGGGPVASEASPFPDGFEIFPDEYRQQHGADADGKISDDVHGWLSQNGYVDLLTQDEYANLQAQMKSQGGSLDDYMDRLWDDMIERDEARTKLQEAQYDEVDWRESPVSQRGNDAEGQGPLDESGQSAPGSDAPRGGASGNGPGDADDPSQVFEQTNAGQQRLIDGVTPITNSDRLAVAGRASLSGGDAPADFGLFDVSGRSQQDMFSDIASKEARARQEAIGSTIREQIDELGDFEIDLGDGKGIRSASAIMEEIENVDDFADVMQLCGRKS